MPEPKAETGGEETQLQPPASRGIAASRGEQNSPGGEEGGAPGAVEATTPPAPEEPVARARKAEELLQALETLAHAHPASAAREAATEMLAAAAEDGIPSRQHMEGFRTICARLHPHFAPSLPYVSQQYAAPYAWSEAGKERRKEAPDSDLD